MAESEWKNASFCPMCGAKADPGDAFCVQCGAKLSASTGPLSVGETGTSAESPASRPYSAPGAQRNRKPLSALLWIALAAFVGYMIFGTAEKTFKNYASAGAYVLPQIVQRDSTVHVAFNIPKFEGELSHFALSNVSLSYVGADAIENTLREAFRYNGNPKEGERLFLLCYATGGKTFHDQSFGRPETLRLNIEMTYCTTAAQEKELETAVNGILAGLHLDGATDYEKIRAIYRYICSNVVYDYEHYENDREYLLQYSAYAAAIHHTAVCSGIADLFYYLANTAGVETHIVTNADHAWNFVRLDGKYYYIDATWDLGKRESEYQYFLKGTSDFIHPYSLDIRPFGYGTMLAGNDRDYDFSPFAYGGSNNI